jgi:hypothetical protein
MPVPKPKYFLPKFLVITSIKSGKLMQEKIPNKKQPMSMTTVLVPLSPNTIQINEQTLKLIKLLTLTLRFGTIGNFSIDPVSQEIERCKLRRRTCLI